MYDVNGCVRLDAKESVKNAANFAFYAACKLCAHQISFNEDGNFGQLLVRRKVDVFRATD